MCKSGGDLTRAKTLASPLSPGETSLTFGPGLPHLEGERRGRWGKVWPVCTRPTLIQILECENEVSSLLLALRKVSPQLCVLFLPAMVVYERWVGKCEETRRQYWLYSLFSMRCFLPIKLTLYPNHIISQSLLLS